MASRNYKVDGFAKTDLTGKLVIKVQLGDDIRCIPILNEEITYDELVLMMQRVYQGKLTNTDEIVIKYKDEDGDMVTIFDSSDLSFAIQCSSILKLILIVNGGPRPLDPEEVKHVKKELQGIRDKVNHLLDCLDETNSSTVEHDLTSADKDVRTVSGNHNEASHQSVNAQRPIAVQQLSVGSSKEFDPLSQKSITMQQTAAYTGAQNAPGCGTPDSINSLGSAAYDSNSTRQVQGQALGQVQGQSQGQTQGQVQGQTHQGYVVNTSQQVSDAYVPHQSQQNFASAHQVQQQQHLTNQQQQLGQQQQHRSAFVQPQISSTAYSQSQTQAGYATQQQMGYTQPTSQQHSGYTQSTPQQQMIAQQPTNNYSQSGTGQQVYSVSNAAQVHGASPQGQAVHSANPYSRGPAYGQYPRPQGQYPQAS